MKCALGRRVTVKGVKAASMKAKISGTARSFDIDPKPSKYRVDNESQWVMIYAINQI